MRDNFKIEWIKIADLKPAVYNPRKDLKPGDLEYQKIQKSINEFGLVDPLIINKDNTVIGGHQRLKVIADAGFDKVPCSVVDLDKTKEKALNIALNRITGEWDFPKLTDLLVELDVGDFDMESIGYSSDELEQLMGYVPDDNKDIDEGAMAETENECPKCGFEW
jgi:ParB-like chromosome segregation protein Spo0J